MTHPLWHSARCMKKQIQRKSPPPLQPRPLPKRRPGPVRRFRGVPFGGNILVLEWDRPRNGTRVFGYRIERTPDGKTYEFVGETASCWFLLDVVPGEPWFYRVTACNSRGVGGYKMVCFYRAPQRSVPGGDRLKMILHHIPVLPGLRLEIWE